MLTSVENKVIILHTFMLLILIFIICDGVLLYKNILLLYILKTYISLVSFALFWFFPMSYNS
jgi:hypothetical protein